MLAAWMASGEAAARWLLLRSTRSVSATSRFCKAGPIRAIMRASPPGDVGEAGSGIARTQSGVLVGQQMGVVDQDAVIDLRQARGDEGRDLGMPDLVLDL